MYKGFPYELLQLVRCPDDAGEMEFEEKQANALIYHGTMRCAICGTGYPVEDGILNLLGDQQDIDALSAHEIEARNREADVYHTYCSEIGDEKEIPSTFRHVGELAGKRALDLGCGTGRFLLKMADQAKEIIGVDFSIESLRILSRSLPEGKNIGLVLADASRFKAYPESFDLVLSAQVLQHLPSLSIRNNLYQNVSAMLKRNGLFICNAYHQSLMCRLHGWPQEGYHDSGIFYHRFTGKELKEEIGKCFHLQALHPISIHVPFSGRLGVNDVWISKKLERVPFINSLGEMLVVKATKL